MPRYHEEKQGVKSIMRLLMSVVTWTACSIAVMETLASISAHFYSETPYPTHEALILGMLATAFTAKLTQKIFGEKSTSKSLEISNPLDHPTNE